MRKHQETKAPSPLWGSEFTHSTKSGGRCVPGTPLGAGETAVTSAKHPSWVAGREETVYLNWEWEERGPNGLFTAAWAGGKGTEGHCAAPWLATGGSLSRPHAQEGRTKRAVATPEEGRSVGREPWPLEESHHTSTAERRQGTHTMASPFCPLISQWSLLLAESNPKPQS